MTTWFDYSMPAVQGRTFTVTFFRGHLPKRRPLSPSAMRKALTGERVGELSIRFAGTPDGDIGDVESVELKRRDGLTPSILQRFPWDHWITASDAYVRHGSTAAVGLAPATKATNALRETGRPGRKGHPPEFYERIARRYVDLRVSGDRHPVKTIADEEGQSRNTAAGWVKKARELGHLPKARRTGKAG